MRHGEGWKWSITVNFWRKKPSLFLAEERSFWNNISQQQVSWKGCEVAGLMINTGWRHVTKLASDFTLFRLHSFLVPLSPTVNEINAFETHHSSTTNFPTSTQLSRSFLYRSGILCSPTATATEKGKLSLPFALAFGLTSGSTRLTSASGPTIVLRHNWHKI